MFLCATRGRPADMMTLIRAMQDAGDVPEVAVMIDDDPDVYAEVPWPAHWHIHAAPLVDGPEGKVRRHLEMTAALNTLHQIHIGEPFYGFFGDHFRPAGPWSRPLAEAAGDWFIAWPDDDWISHYQPGGAITIGGKIVQQLGFVCLPGLVHIATERPYWMMWRDLGNVRHLNGERGWPRVFVYHDKPEVTGRPMDANRQRVFEAQPYEHRDSRAWHGFAAERGPAMIADLRAAMKADGLIFEPSGRLHAQYRCFPYGRGFGRGDAHPIRRPVPPPLAHQAVVPTHGHRALQPPQVYDDAERMALRKLPAELREAFQPLEFLRSGFPTRVDALPELLRFADHLAEPETPIYFQPGARFKAAGFVNAFTSEEYDLLRPLRSLLRDACARDLGRPLRPVLSPMVQIAVARVVTALSARLGRKLRVFEVGPGAGYVGPLLDRLGHAYASTDITQALVLWQRFLFAATAPRCRQVDWWEYVSLNPSTEPDPPNQVQPGPPTCDLVWSNANLGEMHPRALAVVLDKCRRQLAGSALGAVAYFHIGRPTFSDEGAVRAAFHRCGFRQVQERPVALWQSASAPALAPLATIPWIGEGHRPVEDAAAATLDSIAMCWLLEGEEPLDAHHLAPELLARLREGGPARTAGA